MSYKPLSRKKYEQLIHSGGWRLEKGKIDWNLYDPDGNFACSIILAHGKRTKSEVTAFSVHKTKKAFEDRGLKWPPQ